MCLAYEERLPLLLWSSGLNTAGEAKEASWDASSSVCKCTWGSASTGFQEGLFLCRRGVNTGGISTSYLPLMGNTYQIHKVVVTAVSQLKSNPETGVFRSASWSIQTLLLKKIFFFFLLHCDVCRISSLTRN